MEFYPEHLCRRDDVSTNMTDRVPIDKRTRDYYNVISMIMRMTTVTAVIIILNYYHNSKRHSSQDVYCVLLRGKSGRDSVKFVLFTAPVSRINGRKIMFLLQKRRNF